MAARTWDETVDNVWHRLAACDHLLDLKSRKEGDPPPSQGISYATATRHLRILRRRLEEVMGKSASLMDPPWSDISKEQWDLLWSGEVALKKHGETLWIAGHKTVDLYHSLSPAEVPCIMLLGGDSRQTFTTRVPHVLHLPELVRKLLETYLQLADWNQLRRQLIIDLLHESSEVVLMEELDSIKKILDPKTPITPFEKSKSKTEFFVFAETYTHLPLRH